MKTCFIISPIGEENSDTRKHADDFLELLAEPSLKAFEFDVVRADKITTSTIITNDVIERVQQSDLCLVDLTFHNPNVFYECGRRHETGKPTIQLIKKGEQLPFDVAGIRTIEYDLSDPRSTLDSVKKVQDFISSIDATGAYEAASSGASLSTVAETLSRIERKIDQITKVNVTENRLPRSASRAELMRTHPAHAFQLAFDQGDIDSARFVLPRIRKFLSEKEYIAALALLAEIGDDDTKKELLEILPELIKRQEYPLIYASLSGLTDFYANTASFEQGIEDMESLINQFASNEIHDSEHRAFALNRLQMLKYGAEQFEQALSDALQVIQLAPKDDSYHYNLSILYQKLGQYYHAADHARIFVELTQDLEPRHKAHVQEVFMEAGRGDELEQLLSI